MNSKKKKICIADWDGTLSKGYTALHWLEYLTKISLIEKQYIEKFHESLMLFEKGDLTYRALVTTGANIVASSMKGIGTHDIISASKEFSNIAMNYAFSFVPELILFLKEQDIKIVVISGAPMEALKPLCEKIGIEKLYAVEFGVGSDHCYNGNVTINYGLLENKQEIVENIKRNSNIILGMGDSGFDLPILDAAKNRIFMNKVGIPKPISNIHLVSTDNALEHIKTLMEKV